MADKGIPTLAIVVVLGFVALSIAGFINFGNNNITGAFTGQQEECEDGTPINECSIENPGLACVSDGEPTLIPLCGECGCPEGNLCNSETQLCFEPSVDEAVSEIDFVISQTEELQNKLLTLDGNLFLLRTKILMAKAAYALGLEGEGDQLVSDAISLIFGPISQNLFEIDELKSDIEDELEFFSNEKLDELGPELELITEDQYFFMQQTLNDEEGGTFFWLEDINFELFCGDLEFDSLNNNLQAGQFKTAPNGFYCIEDKLYAEGGVLFHLIVTGDLDRAYFWTNEAIIEKHFIKVVKVTEVLKQLHQIRAVLKGGFVPVFLI